MRWPTLTMMFRSSLTGPTAPTAFGTSSPAFPASSASKPGASAPAAVIRPDDTESDTIIIYAPQADSQMINPILVEGRWLEPDDANAIVINTDVLRNEEDIDVGSTITLKIDDKETDWVVVGIARGVLTGPMPLSISTTIGRLTNSVDRAQISQVRLTNRSPENQTRDGPSHRRSLPRQRLPRATDADHRPAAHNHQHASSM